MSQPGVPFDELTALVRAGRIREFQERARGLDPADLADVFAALDEEERLAAVRTLPARLSGQALVMMPEDEHAEETLAALAPTEAAGIVGTLEDDDAADILGEMAPDEQRRILDQVGAEDRAEFQSLLKYGKETAGGLMTARVMTVRDIDTAAEAIEEIRGQSEETGEFYQVFVVDGTGKLQGVLPLRDLVTSRADRPVREFMEAVVHSVRPEEDQEAVARLMSRYNLPSVPVIDQEGRLLGRVTFDDVIDVVEAEGTEDMLKFGGTSADEEVAGTWWQAVKSRLPWLYVNLATAFLAGGVVKIFLDTVNRLTDLAIWMPIIAGMGGNAGTQALAVSVRGLALGLLTMKEFWRVIGKEMLVGLVNGAANGAVSALVALLIHETPMLGVCVFLSMTGNLFVAGFAGAFIPMILKRLNVDPAIASSIFVTTFTDVCGFLMLFMTARALIL
ncbi:MAG TPA: magnesium transporter [Gemmatimonadales bacterium]|nr:magnesium transporter [Gemmatimonadales bacterium]